MLKKIALICVTSAMISSAWAHSPVSELLEQAAYQEETVGDLQAAAKLYEQIAQSHKADRAVAAEALYRLSICYTRMGLHGQSKDILKTLIQDYPQQTHYTRRALQALEMMDRVDLTLQDTPWEDGETIQYTLKGNGGASLGLMDFTARSRIEAGQSLWDLESYTVLPMLDNQIFRSIEATDTGFKPRHIRLEGNQVGKHSAIYRNHSISLSTNGQRSDKPISTQGAVFDNEQMIHLLRRLPLKEGYQTRLNVFENLSKTMLAGDLKVKGSQQLDVPAGHFDTFEVSLSTPSQQASFWIAKGGTRQVVKFENQFFTAELADVRNEHLAPAASFTLEQAQLSMEAPQGWRLFDAGSPSPHYDSYVYAIPPEMGAWALFITKFMDTESIPDLNIERVVAGDLQAIKGFLKEYKLRDNSPYTRDTVNLPAQSFVGDYLHNGQAMVEYRTYLLGTKGIYWFVFRVEAEKFDQYRPQFDALVDSFEAS